MLDLPNIRPIGFGGYRIDDRSSVHESALIDALDTGCNLVDTASNYSDGRSETLIGRVLAQQPQSEAFVVTKAGYVSPALQRELASAGLTCEAANGEPVAYRLDNDAMRVSLATSRRRLGRPCLDAVLVHNPDNLLERGCTAADVYALLGDVFAFLEEEVHDGRLRYYGVSFNHSLAIDSLVAAATRSSSANHFRIVQFPLNLLEREAAESNPSLIERAHHHGLQAISNRPLNALVDGSAVRLAYYEPTQKNCTEAVFSRCVSAVERRLREIDVVAEWPDFAPMKFLRDNREGISDPELVDVVWMNQVLPFVATLFGESLTDEVVGLFERLRTLARACSQDMRSPVTRQAVGGVPGSVIDSLPIGDDLATTAVNYCLSTGVDHVLVGMRDPRYVSSLAALLAIPGSTTELLAH